jgi:hypothetical protein
MIYEAANGLLAAEMLTSGFFQLYVLHIWLAVN